jgi:hypothetical protein
MPERDVGHGLNLSEQAPSIVCLVEEWPVTWPLLLMPFATVHW